MSPALVFPLNTIFVNTTIKEQFRYVTVTTLSQSLNFNASRSLVTTVRLRQTLAAGSQLNKVGLSHKNTITNKAWCIAE